MPYDPEIHGPRVTGPGFHERVYAVVRRVPAGAVTTYGDVAAELGHRRAARQVGYALAALGGRQDVPWQRVVNSAGRVAGRADGTDPQATALRSEGVTVDDDGKIQGFAARRFRFGPSLPP